VRPLEFHFGPRYVFLVSTEQLIAEFKALPAEQRQLVAEAILQDQASWIPESFRQGMEEIERGCVISLESALIVPSR
jgi:hypothetical protein